MTQPITFSRRIMSAAAPLFFTLAVDRLGMVLIVALLAHYATESLAAFVLASAFLFPASVVVMGSLRGVTPVVAPYVDSPVAVVPVLRDVRWLAVFAGIIGSFFVVIFPFSAPLLGVPEVTTDALGYFPILMAIGLFAIAVKQGAVQVLIALDRSRSVVWPGMVDIGVSVGLGVALIPWLGLDGGGIALAAGSIASAIIAMGRLRKFYGRIGWGRPRLAPIKELARIGIPLAAGQLIRVLVFSLLGVAIARLSVDGAASHGILIEVIMLLNLLALVVSQASIPLMSREWAGDNYRGFRKALRASMLVTTVGTVVSVGLFVVAAPWVIPMISGSAAVQEILMSMLPWLVLAALGQGLSTVPTSGLVAVKRTGATLTNVIIWFGLLAVAVFPVAATFGLAGLWIAMGVAQVGYGLGQWLSMRRFLSRSMSTESTVIKKAAMVGKNGDQTHHVID